MNTHTDLGTQADSIYTGGDELQPFTDLMEYVREYTRERPEVVACICFGLGFVLGWKLKPW